MKQLGFYTGLRYFFTLLFPALLFIGVLTIIYEWDLSFVFSIAMPVLVVINIIQLVFFMLKRKSLILFNIASLILFFFFFDSFFQFNFNITKRTQENSISLLSYNVHGFKPSHGNQNYSDENVVDFIRENNPDIVCFQEFSAIKFKLFVDEYPYWVKTNLMIPNQKSVLAIFSKYPIVDKGYVEFANSLNNTMFVDVEISKKVIRVYNVHLESYRTTLQHNINSVRSFMPLLKIVSQADKTRISQAKIVKKHIADYNGDVVILGDFNCTQYTPAYLILKDLRKDTFVEAGNGFGSTYELFNYPFKIDHILVDETFEVVSHKNFNINLSDHEPVLAEIKL
ncbi:endonuclease/exonuclease/phosphatase family protein [Hyunsoonleella pacifica]|uniref:Endonuclease/exonuclease/phosphatase domain-containing protein n=1 Tax=Hyunsoonleella pacifica TaxID=1080224 RepID=A0A4Q9FTA0_9FLAO|nr:endonuclease/exonuclease/phosphatase family protein [Hyunsoonleella pacifica]TBN17419.1 hypothetical protein EYD46_03640 [Hyunsoonleella pacifica]GGD12102.1 endonuclease [Hyunsoonleella pacifica]